MSRSSSPLESPLYSPSPFTAASHHSSRTSTSSQRPTWTADPVKILKTCQRYWRTQDAANPNTFITIRDQSKLRPRSSITSGGSIPRSDEQPNAGQIRGLNFCLGDLHRAVDEYGNVNIPILDEIVCDYFRQIPFHDWVEASVGSRSDAVDNLLMSVALLRLRISQSVKSGTASMRRPGGRPRRFLNPLTQGAIDESECTDLPIEMLDFILDPIRTTISGSNRQHAFLRLMVLSVRFEETYITPKFVDWSDFMSEDFSFAEGLVSETPERLARLVTEADVECFDQMNFSDLCTETENQCDDRWYWLSKQAYECAIISASLTESIYRLASVRCSSFNQL